MPDKKVLEIFRHGSHVAENGQTYTFSEADVRASAAAYDPAVFRAPLVVGHPKTDDPAYGWVGGVSFSEDGKLLADPEQVNPEFAELVNSGAFPKISSSFYPPEHPSNPVPGVYYLRHVGFLGAKAPGVKGLAAASFADSEDNLVTMTLEFSEPDRWIWGSVSRFMRGVRDFIVEKYDLETADRVAPDYAVREVEEADYKARNKPNFSEPEDIPMPEEKKPTDNTQATADFAERESKLNEREQALADREKKLADQAAQARRTEVANFVEGLVEKGQVLPAEQEPMVAFLAGLEDETTISFAEGDEQKQRPAGEFMREFLSALPERVDFAERTAPEDHQQAVNFSAPNGYTVDAAQSELHAKITAHANAKNISYAQAAVEVAG